MNRQALRVEAQGGRTEVGELLADLPPYVDTGKTYRFAQLTLGRVLKGVFRIRVVQGHRVPLDGPVILAGTHRSNLDSVFLPLATPRQVNFMAKREFFKYRPLGHLFRHLGAFPVARGEPDLHAMHRALEVLDAGGVLGIYPEGTRRSGEKIEDLHRGTSWLSARSSVSIVPIGIGGSELVQPRGAKYIKPAPITLFCGHPILPPESTSRPALAEHMEMLRCALQDVFDLAGGPGPAWR